MAKIAKRHKDDAFPDIMTQLLQTPTPPQPRPPVYNKIDSKYLLQKYFFT